MTTVSPTRRERLRAATATEIKDAARRQLVTGGPAAISLRAIARDMGMTAPAIYRYFPSLDALVQAVSTDLLTELRLALESARDLLPDADPVTRLLEMARAFRRWSMANRAEFALLFGAPLAELTMRPGCAPYDAATEFCTVFLTEFTTLWHRRPFPAPPAELIEERLGAHLAPFRDTYGEELPLPVVYVFISGWSWLYGLVAMEVFGQLDWALAETDAFFELELASFGRRLTG